MKIKEFLVTVRIKNLQAFSFAVLMHSYKDAELALKASKNRGSAHILEVERSSETVTFGLGSDVFTAKILSDADMIPAGLLGSKCVFSKMIAPKKHEPKKTNCLCTVEIKIDASALKKELNKLKKLHAQLSN